MKNLSIKIKLIIIFILIKILPLLVIAYIAYEGVVKLDNYLTSSTSFLFNQSKVMKVKIYPTQEIIQS